MVRRDSLLRDVCVFTHSALTELLFYWDFTLNVLVVDFECVELQYVAAYVSVSNRGRIDAWGGELRLGGCRRVVWFTIVEGRQGTGRYQGLVCFADSIIVKLQPSMALLR